jgi:hypothetical protein
VACPYARRSPVRISSCGRRRLRREREDRRLLDGQHQACALARRDHGRSRRHPALRGPDGRGRQRRGLTRGGPRRPLNARFDPQAHEIRLKLLFLQHREHLAACDVDEPRRELVWIIAVSHGPRDRTIRPWQPPAAHEHRCRTTSRFVCSAGTDGCVGGSIARWCSHRPCACSSGSPASAGTKDRSRTDPRWRRDRAPLLDHLAAVSARRGSPGCDDERSPPGHSPRCCRERRVADGCRYPLRGRVTVNVDPSFNALSHVTLPPRRSTMRCTM